MTFSGVPFFKTEPRNLIRARLKAVAATDALVLIDNHRPLRQLGDGLDRADPGTGRLNAVLTRQMAIGLERSVFGVDEQIDHHPVIGCEIRLPIGDQFIPLHL